MKYYIRETSARIIVNRFGKLDYVTKIEYFKTNDNNVLESYNKYKRYKFIEVPLSSFADAHRRKLLIHQPRDVIFTDYYNDYYKICDEGLVEFDPRNYYKEGDKPLEKIR